MAEDRIVSSFRGLFRGNTSFFVRHQAPFTWDDKKKKFSATWCGFAAYGTKSFPKVPEGLEKGDPVPVTKELFIEHLNGGNGLALSPLMNTVVKGKKEDDEKRLNNVCHFAVIDIDIYNVNFILLIQKLQEGGFRFASFLSKSGGLHIYFFFANPEPAEAVIKTLKKLVEVYGLDKIYQQGSGSKVEIFPKQATFTPGSTQSNAIFLPYYNIANKEECPNKMLSPEGKLLGISKAIEVMESKFTSLSEINEAILALPYSDAPYCIQTILLNGLLSEHDHRNDFLFSAAVYLKKKYQKDFDDKLEEINQRLSEPLLESDVTAIYNSVTKDKKHYDAYGCKKSPCCDFCDRDICRKRTWGVGRDKGNTITGAECWGQISKVVDAGGELQHYIWDIKVSEESDFKPVRIDDIEDFESQLKIRTACRRDLNWAPLNVKQDAWIGIINTAMENIETRVVEIAKGTGTSEDVLLRTAVFRYLAYRQIQNGEPYMIKNGQVYRGEEYYYFTTEGLMRFLAGERFPLYKKNIHMKLKSFGCENAEVEYTSSKGVTIKISCWRKKEDEELIEMGTYYDDVFEGDEEYIKKTFKPKEDKGDKGGYDIRF